MVLRATQYSLYSSHKSFVVSAQITILPEGRQHVFYPFVLFDRPHVAVRD